MIYFIQDEVFIKIGFTTDINSRFSSIKGHNPRDLVLLGTVEGGMAEEAILHRRFKKFRHRYEWFNATDELLAWINKTLSDGRLDFEAPTRPVNKLGRAEAIRLAVAASVDPRTIQKVLRGEPAVGMSGDRARKILIENGLLSEELMQATG